MAKTSECSVLIVGDAKVGKTALIHRLNNFAFLEQYSPTGFDKVLSVQEVNKQRVEFVIWDTSGSPAYDSVRSLSYQEADVFLLCFKIADPISLYNVKNKWMPEIRKHRTSAPVVLCGTQADLRTDQEIVAALAKLGRTPISQEQALAICCEIEAVNYIETSCKDSDSDHTVHEAFELCALAAAQHRSTSPSRSVCSSQKNLLHNVSFSSHNSDASVKRNSCSASSSLKKCANASFSGSENEPHLAHLNQHMAGLSHHGSTVLPPSILEDDDVFPGLPRPPPPPLSPRLAAEQRRRLAHRSSMGCISTSSSSSCQKQQSSILRNEFVEGVLFTSTVTKSPRASAVVSPIDATPIGAGSSSSSVATNINANVRPNGLSRRTSFRNASQKTAGQAIPVSTPKSPLGSMSSYDLQSPNLESSSAAQPQQTQHPQPTATLVLPSGVTVPIFDVPAKRSSQGAPKVGFESLKRHTSTGSQGSTGSKSSTGSSMDSGNIPKAGLQAADNGRGHMGSTPNIIDPSVPNTEDPELIGKLRFTSPKSGIYRPVSTASGSKFAGQASVKKKSNCSIM